MCPMRNEACIRDLSVPRRRLVVFYARVFPCSELRYRYKPRYLWVIYDFVGARAIRRH